MYQELCNLSGPWVVATLISSIATSIKLGQYNSYRAYITSVSFFLTPSQVTISQVKCMPDEN